MNTVGIQTASNDTKNKKIIPYVVSAFDVRFFLCK